jgi:DNA adenine methylase
MKQLPLPGIQPKALQAVNVASVPHRSPFRYPGGKTWFVPYFRRWIETRPERIVTLIEPFAGGGVIGLTAAFEGLAEKVILVELDEDVAAVWQTIIEDETGGDWLAQQILSFDMSPESITQLLDSPSPNSRQRAFQTIVRNRINRGGILAPGAGRVKQGENGKGVTSRWYPVTLAKRIRDIARIREKMQFIHADGLDIISAYTQAQNAAFFVDPPYSMAGKKAGKRLYTHSEIDHAALFALMDSVNGDFLMTYDDNPAVRDLASQYGFATELIPMKNTHHNQMLELIISNDLNLSE